MVERKKGERNTVKVLSQECIGMVAVREKYNLFILNINKSLRVCGKQTASFDEIHYAHWS